MNKKKMIKLYFKNGVVLPRLNAYEALEKLVERDTPKKIKYNDYEKPCCPDCGEVQCPNVYAIIRNNFCPYCGQRLDWS